MAIKINKGGPLGKYYYLRENVEFGPIELMELLEYVSADTMVYVQGGAWKKASEYPELIRFFTGEQKVVEKVVERVVETQGPTQKSSNAGLKWLIWLILIIIAVGAYYFSEQQKANLARQLEMDRLQQQAAFDDSLRAEEQMRIQDSMLMASNAILDSARLLKLEVEYQSGTQRTASLLQNFFMAMSGRQSDLSGYFTDTIAAFERHLAISKYDLSTAINADKHPDPSVTERFEFNDSSLVFRNLDGDLGCFTFTLNYKLFDNNSNAEMQNKKFDVLVKLNSNLKISYLELFQNVEQIPAN
jgi:hypothetical protein